MIIPQDRRHFPQMFSFCTIKSAGMDDLLQFSGIGIGEELEYTDEVTLGRSLLSRTDFEQSYLKH